MELKETDNSKPKRFVILTHDHPFPHWDLMLEQSGILRTWRLLDAPDCNGKLQAEPLPDHRIKYLDYEGPLSNNRGSVARWDAGSWFAMTESNTELVIKLTGERIDGVFRYDGTHWQTVPN